MATRPSVGTSGTAGEVPVGGGVGGVVGLEGGEEGAYAGAATPLDPSIVMRIPDQTITGLLETTQ